MLETSPIIEKVKSVFTRHSAELEYLPDHYRFSWSGTSRSALPREPGVYCLFSHEGERIQKIGKTENERGLHGRFADYTSKKTERRLLADRTDQRWRRIMTCALHGERLSLYYYVTAPKNFELPFRFDDGVEINIDCHWARSLEKYLSKLVRSDCAAKGLSTTHMLLSGLSD